MKWKKCRVCGSVPKQPASELVMFTDQPVCRDCLVNYLKSKEYTLKQDFIRWGAFEWMMIRTRRNVAKAMYGHQKRGLAGLTALLKSKQPYGGIK